MQPLAVSPNQIDTSALLGRQVEPLVGSLVVDKPTVVKDKNDKPLIVVGRLKDNWDVIPSFLKLVKYQNNRRVTRLKNDFDTHRSSDISFGFRPERPIFNLPAGPLAFNRDYPEWYKVLTKLGVWLQGEYAAHSPDKFGAHRDFVKANVGDDWLIPSTIFSQGIVNNSVSLDYHFDKNNIKGAWSCMAVFRSKTMDGGDLIVPELNLTIKTPDHSFVLFDGQSLLHGVTPLKRQTKNAYRFSIVYYTIEAMAGLGSFKEQLERMKVIDTKAKFK